MCLTKLAQPPVSTQQIQVFPNPIDGAHSVEMEEQSHPFGVSDENCMEIQKQIPLPMPKGLLPPLTTVSMEPVTQSKAYA